MAVNTQPLTDALTGVKAQFTGDTLPVSTADIHNGFALAIAKLEEQESFHRDVMSKCRPNGWRYGKAREQADSLARVIASAKALLRAPQAKPWGIHPDAWRAAILFVSVDSWLDYGELETAVNDAKESAREYPDDASDFVELVESCGRVLGVEHKKVYGA